MRNYLLLKIILALVLLIFVCTSVSSADGNYHRFTGYVVDINGNGIPGAKVSLLHNGYVALADSSNPTYTNNNGMYYFDLSYLPGEGYQVLVEIGGKQSSTPLAISGNYTDYTVKTISISNYAVSSGNPPPQPTAAPTLAPSPTAALAPSPTEAANATVAPANETATPPVSSTPVSTPGFAFTLIPALAVICLIALRKRK